MAANSLPSGIGDLFLLGERIESGLRLHGPWLMKGATSLEVVAPLLEAARAAEAKFSIARARKSAVAKRFTMADAALTSWLAKARLVAMLAYGSKWSEGWLATGFTHRGTNVPKRIAPRMELSRRLAEFFAIHRDYEVPFASVTAKAAHSHCAEITAAEHDLRRANTAVKSSKRVRDSAEKSLRREMSFVVVVLSRQLGKSDPRWLEFGLKQPRPDAPPKSARYGGGTPTIGPLVVDFGAGSGAPGSDKAAA
jgi:hypothetical protein